MEKDLGRECLYSATAVSVPLSTLSPKVFFNGEFASSVIPTSVRHCTMKVVLFCFPQIALLIISHHLLLGFINILTTYLTNSLCFFNASVFLVLLYFK